MEHRDDNLPVKVVPTSVLAPRPPIEFGEMAAPEAGYREGEVVVALRYQDGHYRTELYRREAEKWIRADADAVYPDLIKIAFIKVLLGHELPQHEVLRICKGARAEAAQQIAVAVQQEAEIKKREERHIRFFQVSELLPYSPGGVDGFFFAKVLGYVTKYWRIEKTKVEPPAMEALRRLLAIMEGILLGRIVIRKDQ